MPADEVSEQFGRVERFFAGPWNTAVHKARWVLVLIGLGVAGYAGYRSTEIEGLKTLEVYFPDWHRTTHGYQAVISGFNDGAFGQTIAVDFMWGVEGINKTLVDRYNASDIGTVIWDPEFDLTPPENQQQAYDFC